MSTNPSACETIARELKKQATRARKGASAWVESSSPFDSGKMDYNRWPDDEVMATDWLPEFASVMERAAALLRERAEPPQQQGNARKTWGHCGSCGGHEFTVTESCDGCGESEVLEHLIGEPQAAPPERSEP